MRLITWLLICIGVVTITTAQNTDQKEESIKHFSHEFGVNVTRSSDIAPFEYDPFALYENAKGFLIPNFGLSYRVQFKPRSSFRAFVGHYRESKHFFGNSYETAWDFINEERKFDLTLGLERRISTGKHTAYVFGDVFQLFGNRTRYSAKQFFHVHNHRETSYKYYQLGLASGVGAKLNITNNWYLNLELQVRITEEFKPDEHQTILISRFQHYVNPISRFSLNYRLNQKKSQH